MLESMGWPSWIYLLIDIYVYVRDDLVLRHALGSEVETDVDQGRKNHRYRHTSPPAPTYFDTGSVSGDRLVDFIGPFRSMNGNEDRCGDAFGSATQLGRLYVRTHA